MVSNIEKTDPRVLRTRRLLIDAFVSLQAEKVFDDITIQDITTRATVNRATFYAHFQDKYALLDDIIREGFRHTLLCRLGSQPDTTQEHVRQLLLAVMDHLTAVQNRCQRSYQMFESLVEAQIKGQLRAHIHAWLQEQPRIRVQARRRLEVGATLMSGAIYGAATEWANHAHELAAEDYADETMPLIAASVAALAV